MLHNSSEPISVPEGKMTLQRQERCWDAYMSIYNNQAYHSKEHEDWVHDMMRKYPELCQTTLIYHTEDRQDGYINDEGWHVYGTDDKIRENLRYPIPIYWGKERDDLFSWDAVRKGLGYNKKRTLHMPDELRDTIRYAIVGKVKVKKYGDLPERDSHVIHTEGINLESQHTATFKSIIVGKCKDDILQEYFSRYRAILKIIIEAAMSQTNEGESAFIQAPMIGAGCFLRGIKETGLDVNEFLEQQINAYHSVLNMAPREYNFIYKLCIFNTADFSNDIIAAYRSIAESDPRFKLGTNMAGGNVLADVPFGNPSQKVFVVNPGDLRSFIGNGMSEDNSVEGYIVANTNNYNPQWQNTSFLHNAYFNPDIMNPIKSIQKGNIVWKETMSW